MTSELQDLICRIDDPFSKEHYEKCRKHWDTLAKPLDGLGDFEELVARIGGIRHTALPSVRNRKLLLFLSDNGVVEEGVSQCGPEVTHSVAEAMSRRRSTACVMAEKAGIDVYPVDIGMIGAKLPGITDHRIREGTRNLAFEPAMNAEELSAAILTGARAVETLCKDGMELLLLGEMGIGNTTTATAVSCGILGLDPEEVPGRGAGLSNEKLKHKCSVIREALKRYDMCGKRLDHAGAEPPVNEAARTVQEGVLRILICVGGYDIAGMTGALLMAAVRRIPVVLDGLITLSAALAATLLCPKVREILIPSHFPREPMGRRILEELKLHAVIDGNLALGEGTGAILLIPMLDVCLEYYNNGICFDCLGIEAYQRFEEEMP